MQAMELPTINTTRANPPQIISFSAVILPTTDTDKNTSCLLTWETKYTTKVTIEGLGEVPLNGDYEILECAYAPEFITLSADNDKGFGAQTARINTKDVLGLNPKLTMGSSKNNTTRVRTTPYYPRSYYPRGIYPHHVYPRRYY